MPRGDYLTRLLGALFYFDPVDRALPVIVEARLTMQGAFSVPIEGSRAGTTLRDGLQASRFGRDRLHNKSTGRCADYRPFFFACHHVAYARGRL